MQGPPRKLIKGIFREAKLTGANGLANSPGTQLMNPGPKLTSCGDGGARGEKRKEEKRAHQRCGLIAWRTSPVRESCAMVIMCLNGMSRSSAVVRAICGTWRCYRSFWRKEYIKNDPHLEVFIFIHAQRKGCQLT